MCVEPENLIVTVRKFHYKHIEVDNKVNSNRHAGKITKQNESPLLRIPGRCEKVRKVCVVTTGVDTCHAKRIPKPNVLNLEIRFFQIAFSKSEVRRLKHVLLNRQLMYRVGTESHLPQPCDLFCKRKYIDRPK